VNPAGFGAGRRVDLPIRERTPLAVRATGRVPSCVPAHPNATSRLRRIVPALLLAALSCSDDPTAPVYTPSGPCDGGLPLDAPAPSDAARAMGICDGLVTAAWVYPDGSAATTGGSFDLGHGVLPAFGTNNPAREGSALLALSSGTARSTTQVGYTDNLDKGYVVTPPAGFPRNQASCPAVSSEGHDGIALSVTLVVPAGVRFMTFDYAFFTRDYPTYDCTAVVDQAAGLVSGAGGSATVQNVLLDGSGNPMLASPTALMACAPSTGYTCPLGTGPLTATGMSASSGWLTTASLAVTPGDTIVAVFAVWDSLDGIIDSTVLLDDFRWAP
jgi:hypothetical protein